MKVLIKGDTEPAHIAAAYSAIEEHKKKYGTGNKSHPFTYSIRYRANIIKSRSPTPTNITWPTSSQGIDS